MAKFYYDKGGRNVYIKDIDFAQTKLTFTTNYEKAYVGRDGYYAAPLCEQIRRLFADDYPEVKGLQYTY